MIERVATKILAMIDDVRWSRHELDYLAWQIVTQSPRPMRRRIAILADAITFHINNDNEENDYGADTLF
jgi:hypothetical protein